MNLRISRTACAAGIAAVFVIGSPASAQQTTGTARDTTADTTRRTTVTDTTRRVTSTQRIPVRKDAGVDTMTTSTGAVDTTTTVVAPPPPPPPADTAVAADTATVVEETTVAVVEPVPVESDVLLGRGMFGNGFYIGIAGGGTVPQGDMNDAYNTGFNVTVPIGWQSLNTPWGVRLDLAYNRMSGETSEFDDGGVEFDDGSIWSAMLGVTGQWPVGGTGPSFYLVGGGGVHHLRDFGELRSVPGTDPQIENENVTKFGLNGGAGINFPIGSADLFVEGRYVSVFTENTNMNYIPIVLGLRFF